MSEQPTVTLYTAWSWTCPKCAQTNLAQSVAYDATDEDVRAFLGLDPHEPIPEGWAGGWQTSPVRVMCRSCAETFKAKADGEDDHA